MTKDEQEKLKKILTKDRQRIEGELRGLKNTDYGSDVDSGDEEADETEQMATNYPISGILETRLDGINEALEKMEKGTYGICKSCGKELPMERLLAKPESSICAHCQEHE